MGVPRLFPWLIKMFPGAHIHFNPSIGPDGTLQIVHVIDPKTKKLIKFEFPHIDGLYLDANGLLHSAAQIVFNYGSEKRKIDPYAKLTYEQRIKKVYEIFFNMIKNIVIIVNPKKVLYIAIDGPAPLAKQAQQRQRRFVSALESSSTDPLTGWESTCITPGTIFMFELTKYMHYMIRKEMSSSSGKGLWAKLDVLFSPPTVPGEGEHKIMDYMRSLDEIKAKEMVHCMFGPDGDLIMLTLAAHLPKMYLFRSDQYQPGFYDLLDMGMVRNSLHIVLKQQNLITSSPSIFKNARVPQKKSTDSTNRLLDDIVNDFVLLGFFVGNDFLPKLQMFTYLEDGLALVLSLYEKYTSSGVANSFLTLDNNMFFDKGIFPQIVKDMASRELLYLQNQASITFDDPCFIDNTLLNNIKGGVLVFPSFRRDYYAKSDIVDPGDMENPSGEVRQMCLEYLKCIAWVFKYYVEGIPSWSHYYARYYAPLMTDLSHVLDTLTAEEILELKTFDIGEPSLPFVQLLSIIAPKNVALLPKPFHRLMLSNESPLVQAGYYPETFDIDYEGKTKKHMGVALLPFIDVEEVRLHYAPIAKKLKNTYVRNQVGCLECFVYDPSYTATYVSDYGQLKNMHIRKILV